MSERAAEPRDVLASEPNVAEDSGLGGQMGVSSERVGKVRGSREPRTTGAEDLGIADAADESDEIEENEEAEQDQPPG